VALPPVIYHVCDPRNPGRVHPGVLHDLACMACLSLGTGGSARGSDDDTADGTENALAAQVFEQREQHTQAAGPALRSRQVMTYTPAALRVLAKRQAGIRARSSSSGVVRSLIPTTLLSRKDGFKDINDEFLELRNSNRLGTGDSFVEGSNMWVDPKQFIGVRRCRLNRLNPCLKRLKQSS